VTLFVTLLWYHCCPLNSFNDSKVVSIEQPYKEYDEKTDSKKIKRGGIFLAATGEGEVTIELRCAPGEKARYNCTTHEAINVRVICMPVATAAKS